jgi:FkbM family methyltransferase
MNRLLIDALAHPVIVEALIDSPLIYVDVGAAEGVEQPWLSIVQNYELTRVVAFEPHPENFAGIKRLPNGTYHQAAISPVIGSVEFYLDGTASSILNRSDVTGRSCDTARVPSRQLAKLRSCGDIASLDIIKTDAEEFDFQALSTAEDYLERDTLAVQCEFAFAPSGEQRPFCDYDTMLRGKGFMLFWLSTQRGHVGELQGGNFVYLRDIRAISSRADARILGLKLFVISVALSNLQYAYSIVRRLGDTGVLSGPETRSLEELALSRIYVPDALSTSFARLRLASVFGMLSQLAAGFYWRGVTCPDANRISNYPQLVRTPNALWRREPVRQLYEHSYRRFLGGTVAAGAEVIRNRLS